MVVMKIKLYKDSAGALLAEFLDGINSVSQNNSNVNEVLVVLDNFELAVGEVLRIGYELSTGEEVEDYTLMKDNFDGTYSAEIPYAVANGETDAEWQLGLQVASNWVETESYTGYRNKQNLVAPLLFTVNNAVKDRNGKYPKLGDIQTLYDQAVEKIESEEKNAEEIENLKNEKGQPNGIATLDENGKVPEEQLPDDIGGGLPEGFNPEDYVKFTDYATSNKAGVVKIDAEKGFLVDANGVAVLYQASSFDIDQKKSLYKPITPSRLDYAVKVGITTNTEEWTDEDKAAACDLFGAIKADTSGGTYRCYGVDSAGNPRMWSIASTDGSANTTDRLAMYRTPSSSNTGENEVTNTLLTCVPQKPYQAANMEFVTNLHKYFTMSDDDKNSWLTMLGITTEEWTFTLEDGTTVTKTVLTK